jgi:hypothetical protein
VNIVSHLKQQWLGLLISTVSIGLAVYFYAESREERDPVFMVDPSRVEIISHERVANSPIKVLHDHTPIQGDVYAVRFFFWNAGKRSIRPENVLEPIQVTLSDSGSEILDFRPLKTSRPVAHVQLTRPQPNSQTLLVTFSILERGDGMGGQIIYQGKSGAPLQVTGTIEGAEIRTTAAPSLWASIGEFAGALVLISLGLIVVLVLIAIVVTKVSGWLKVKERLEKHPRVKSALRVSRLIGGVSIGILVLIGMFLAVRQQEAANVVNVVPRTLVP